MTRFFSKTLLLSFTLSALCAGSLLAARASKTPNDIYLNGNNSTGDNGYITLLGGYGDVSKDSLSSSGASGGLNLGVLWGSNFATEISGYIFPNVKVGDSKVYSDVYAAAFAGEFIANMATDVQLFAKVGVGYTSAKQGDGESAKNNTAVTPMFGLGGNYALTDSLEGQISGVTFLKRKDVPALQGVYLGLNWRF